jgi:hypothetical protein
VQVGVPARLGPVGDAELAVDVRQVELDRLLGHPQGPGDAAVGVAHGHVAEDLELAIGERAVDRRNALRGLVAVDDVAVRDLAQQRAEAHRVHGLGDDRAGAGVERRPDALVVHAPAEEQADRVRHRLAQLAETGGGEGGVGHVVDEHDVGPGLDERRPGGAAAVYEADDVEAGGLAQGQPDAGGGDGAVRHDDEALHVATLPWRWGARVKTASLPGWGRGITPVPLMGARPAARAVRA